MKRVRKLPHIEHDVRALAQMIYKCHRPRSKCCITGISLHELRKVGEQLSVDRIDSSLGYVVGNMQLMTKSLNSEKGAGKRVPKSAIARLQRKLAKVRSSRLSRSPQAGRAEVSGMRPSQTGHDVSNLQTMRPEAEGADAPPEPC